MSQNTVVNLKKVGATESGICIHGPLVGKRVVRFGIGPWMPAGEATKEEMLAASDTAYGNLFDKLFGRGGAA
jgi:hypothetical protein